MAYLYGVIKSRLSGLVLDIDAASSNPGARVVPWNRNNQDNQVWYQDPATGTIRSKLNNFCLDLQGDQLVVNPFVPGNVNQQWEYQGASIRNRYNTKLVLDIYGNKKEPGAQIGSYEFNGGDNQMWDFENVGGHAPIPGPTPSASTQAGYPVPAMPSSALVQEFSIVSEMNFKAVDIQGGSPGMETPIVMWTPHNPPQKNQLWHFDSQGFLQSSLNNFVFSNMATAGKLKMFPSGANPRGQWRIEAQKIVNMVGECLEICQSESGDGAELCSNHYRGSLNQLWRLQYV